MPEEVNSEEVNAIKGLRVQIDGAIQEVDHNIALYGSSRALALAKTKLEEAKMWCGKRFEEIGRELPKEYQDKAGGSNAEEASE